jgi:hypothetical protein
MEAEAGNLAAAVRWYLDHDRAPLPHLFWVLWLFWELRDHLGEAREWVGQLMPAAASLDRQARAELLWTAVATANEVHDDTAALAASQRLAPLLGGIEDPYLQAICQLVIARTSPITGDFDGALRQALGSLAALRAQDEKRTGRRWPPSAPATWRPPQAILMTRSATCRRGATWRGASATSGRPPGPAWSWAR